MTGDVEGLNVQGGGEKYTTKEESGVDSRKYTRGKYQENKQIKIDI